jgi:hypothetical protein
MMTQDEFQKKYYNYQTFREVEAQAEAAKANAEGIDGNEAVAVHLQGLGWCLMLKSAADFAKEIGII